MSKTLDNPTLQSLISHTRDVLWSHSDKTKRQAYASGDGLQPECPVDELPADWAEHSLAASPPPAATTTDPSMEDAGQLLKRAQGPVGVEHLYDPPEVPEPLAVPEPGLIQSMVSHDLHHFQRRA